MKVDYLIRQVSFGIAAAILFDRIVLIFIDGFALSGNVSSLLLGVLSLVAFFLGFSKYALFAGAAKLSKGLSLALVLNGIICGVQSLYFYKSSFGDTIKFLLAIIMLMIIGYAMYSLHKKQNVKKG